MLCISHELEDTAVTKTVRRENTVTVLSALTEKHLCVSAFPQFPTVLFEGQLYLLGVCSNRIKLHDSRDFVTLVHVCALRASKTV